MLRVSDRRVLALFARMSAAHQSETRAAAARGAGPVRKEQRAEEKKNLRRDLEAWRREQGTNSRKHSLWWLCITSIPGC